MPDVLHLTKVYIYVLQWIVGSVTVLKGLSVSGSPSVLLQGVVELGGQDDGGVRVGVVDQLPLHP